MKKLIVNADDFGYSKGINEGIIKGHEEGVVTSASLMVYGSAALHAAALAKKTPHVGLGLHFQIENFDVELFWQLKKTVASLFIESTKKNFIRQVDTFKKLTGNMPDHIDSHHHIHRAPKIYQFIALYCKENGIPMRDQVNFIGSFFGKPSTQNISIQYLRKIIKNLPEGITELMCHPGLLSNDLKSSYAQEREIELMTLTSPEVKKEIEKLNISLISWKEI